MVPCRQQYPPTRRLPVTGLSLFPVRITSVSSPSFLGSHSFYSDNDASLAAIMQPPYVPYITWYFASFFTARPSFSCSIFVHAVQDENALGLAQPTLPSTRLYLLVTYRFGSPISMYYVLYINPRRALLLLPDTTQDVMESSRHFSVLSDRAALNKACERRLISPFATRDVMNSSRNRPGPRDPRRIH